MPFRSALILTSALWVAFELSLLLRRRASGGQHNSDAGSLRLLNVVIYSSVALGITLASLGRGVVALPMSVRWVGLAVIVAGLALRIWAIRVLARFFTVDVAIHADHQLIESGPYRWMRHPSYTGVLLSFVGLVVCYASWVAALVILVPVTLVFLRRIAIEEAALEQAFPDTYPAYARRTSRLIPGLF